MGVGVRVWFWAIKVGVEFGVQVKAKPKAVDNIRAEVNVKVKYMVMDKGSVMVAAWAKV